MGEFNINESLIIIYINKTIIVLVWAICMDLGYQPAWVARHW